MRRKNPMDIFFKILPYLVMRKEGEVVDNRT